MDCFAKKQRKFTLHMLTHHTWIKYLNNKDSRLDSLHEDNVLCCPDWALSTPGLSIPSMLLPGQTGSTASSTTAIILPLHKNFGLYCHYTRTLDPCPAGLLACLILAFMASHLFLSSCSKPRVRTQRLSDSPALLVLLLPYLSLTLCTAGQQLFAAAAASDSALAAL